MNWKWGIAIGVMVFVTLVSVVFAFVQQTVAEASMREAETQFQQANTCRVESEKQKRIAEASVAEAIRQQQLTEEFKVKLEQCRGKK